MNWNEAAKLLYFIPRLCDVEQGQLLFETAKILPLGARLLEIGAWKGYSTCALGLGCMGRGALIYTIDTFRGNPENTNQQDGPDSYPEFWQQIARLGLVPYVTPLVGRSEDFYRGWKEPLDLLFIDGDHARMKEDYEAFYPYLKSGGWLFMHDIYQPNAEEYAIGMTFQNNLGYKVKP